MNSFWLDLIVRMKPEMRAVSLVGFVMSPLLAASVSTHRASNSLLEPVGGHPDRAFILEEVWRVGGLDAAEEYQFSGPTLSVAWGPQGAVAVLDPQRGIVSVLDGRSGVFSHTVGGPGQGPGELREPGGLVWDREGRLWVENAFDGRLSLFEESGRFLRSVKRAPHGVNLLVFPLAVDSAGSVVSHKTALPNLQVLRIDTLGGVSEPLAIEMPESRWPSGPIRPGSPARRALGFRPVLRWALSPDGRHVWTVRSDSLVLSRYAWSGGAARRFVFKHRVGRFTSDQERAVEEAVRTLKGPVDVAPLVAQGIHVLSDGRVLVQVGREPSVPGRDFDVFSPQGSFLGTLSSPFDMPPRSILASRGDTLIFPARGEFDVLQVVKAVIRVAGAG